MVHEPGHLQFDDSAPRKAVPGAPKPVEFGSAGSASKAGRAAELPQRPAHEPAPLFGETANIAPALDYARATFPDLANIEAQGVERKIRQLIPWRQEVVASFGSKALDENAAVTLKAAQLISRYAECGIGETVDKALSASRRGESGLLSRLFLRGRLISSKPALKVARSQLTELLRECAGSIAELEPLDRQLRSSLVALVAANEALPKPGESAVEAAIHARRLLLQQSIHQSELTRLQLQELKQQMSAQLANVERLLTVTIPAFEIADAGK